VSGAGLGAVLIVTVLLTLLLGARGRTTTVLIGAAADQTATPSNTSATATTSGTPRATTTAPTTPTPPRATATPTPPGPGVHILSAQGIVNSSYSGVDAVCPTGELALSGGWLADANHPVLASLRLNRSDVDWQVGALSKTDLPMSAYVVCLQHAPEASITERQDFVEVASGAAGTVVTPCLAGEVPVGGGLTHAPDFTIAHFGLSPDQSGFRLTVVNYSAASWSAGVYAECLRAPGARLTVPSPATASLGRGSFGTVQATCPKGTMLTGGGIDLLNGSAVAYGFAPASATTWQAQVQNQSAVATTVNVYALCLSFF
jgi:hypothetical protein